MGVWKKNGLNNSPELVQRQEILRVAPHSDEHLALLLLVDKWPMPTTELCFYFYSLVSTPKPPPGIQKKLNIKPLPSIWGGGDFTG
jgi:hypothetical protein